MLPARHLVLGQRRQQVLTPAQKIAQHAVHHALENTASQFAGSDHRLIDDGMVRILAGFQAVQGGQQQGLRRQVRQGLLHQLPEEEFTTPTGTQHTVNHILRRCPCGWRFFAKQSHGFRQAFPLLHGGNHPCRQQQAPAQRIGRECRGRWRRCRARRVITDTAEYFFYRRRRMGRLGHERLS